MRMQIKPILAALSRHRAATLLIVLQVALTLAIVCNALFIAQQRVAYLSRATGIDEAHIAVIHNQWVGSPGLSEANASMLRDLVVLRGLPGVADAYADYSYPAAGPSAQLLGIALAHGQPRTSWAESYYADEHMLSTLGLKLVAGRNFRADEIVPLAAADGSPAPPSIIVTRDLADTLFPQGGALGRAVFIGDKPSTIIGVIADLQVPAVGTRSFAHRSVLMPNRLAAASETYYLVRARPGQMDAVMHAAPMALLAADRMRIIEAGEGVQRFSDLRAAAYARDYGVATLMSLLCVILLGATAGGIFGFTSFWVGQRRKQIGIRRAVGATRRDILRHFQTENFLIVSGGIALGLLLAVVLNLILMKHYELPRLPLFYLPIGALMLWLLGQLAVLGPALHAAAVPPVVATRSA
jgi:putative ABC transport system permease protein